MLTLLTALHETECEIDRRREMVKITMWREVKVLLVLAHSTIWTDFIDEAGSPLRLLPIYACLLLALMGYVASAGMTMKDVRGRVLKLATKGRMAARLGVARSAT